MSTILKIENLSFANIINYPNVGMMHKEMTFITGDSGCGKSTLLKLFNGVISPTGGTIEYNGINIENIEPITLRKDVLLVSQSVYLFDKSIKENFHEYYSYLGISLLNDEQINKYLHLCCADFPLDMPCATMSGGERHRVYIAICLSLMPKILMLDEPTSALDIQNSIDLLSNIKEFCTNNHITTIVVCHDKELTRRFADNVVILEKRCIL